jgi:hypothetical protein
LNYLPTLIIRVASFERLVVGRDARAHQGSGPSDPERRLSFGSSLAPSCSPARDAALFALACCARRRLRFACDGGSGDQTLDASRLFGKWAGCAKRCPCSGCPHPADLNEDQSAPSGDSLRLLDEFFLPWAIPTAADTDRIRREVGYLDPPCEVSRSATSTSRAAAILSSDSSVGLALAISKALTSA